MEIFVTSFITWAITAFTFSTMMKREKKTESDEQVEIRRSIVQILNYIEEEQTHDEVNNCLFYNIENNKGKWKLCYKPDCGYYWKEKE